MSEVKICPACRTEYFPDREHCADCGAVLLSAEEDRRVQEKKKNQLGSGLVEPVVLRRGSLQWMDELCRVLIDSGIPCCVDVEPGCKRGGCGSTYWLLVSRQYGEEADARIETYCRNMHPEIKDALEMINQGKCPACGCDVPVDAVMCPECGLTLLIIEE